MRATFIKVGLLSGGLLPCLASVSAGAQVVASTGVDYTGGTYGTGQRLKSLSAPATVRATKKRVTVLASISYIRLDGPGNVIAAGGFLGLPIIVDPSKPAIRTRRSGWGDTTVGAVYRVPADKFAGVTMGFSASTKIPTASTNKGLGTGKADYAIGMDIARPGKLAPFAAASYTIVGQPDDYQLRDITAVRAGVALRLGKIAEASVSYNYATRAINGIPNRQEVGAGLDTNLSSRLSLGVQGTAGLTNGAPDAGAGMRLGIRL